MSEPILVTGGAGYIGSHCCQLLSKEGFLPVTLDNLSTGWESLVRFGPLEVGDTRNREDLDRVFAQYRPKTVMHFAARALAGDSVARPLDYYDNNVAGSLSLLSACREHGIHTFVFSSTCAVYGAAPSPVPLTAPIAPVSPYGASKAMVERMLGDMVPATGFAATCFRYFNAAGADPEGVIGERHEPETHVVPKILKAAAAAGTFTLYGDDYGTPDGTCVRDYIHVSDIAAAHVAAIRAPGRRGEVRYYNLGTGRGHSVREVLEACEKVSGRTIPVSAAPRRPGDPPELVAGDVDIAEKELGWRPLYPDLERTTAVRTKRPGSRNSSPTVDPRNGAGMAWES